MGHCPQNHRSSSHCPGRGIRFQFLHRPMRIITLAIIHCSATPQGVRLSFDDCRREHIRRGFSDIGYHFYITRNGEIHRGRPLEKIGAHCQNHNRHSIGICYEGGLDTRRHPHTGTAGIVSGTAARTETDFSENSGSGTS